MSVWSRCAEDKGSVTTTKLGFAEEHRARW